MEGGNHTGLDQAPNAVGPRQLLDLLLDLLFNTPRVYNALEAEDRATNFKTLEFVPPTDSPKALRG